LTSQKLGKNFNKQGKMEYWLQLHIILWPTFVGFLTDYWKKTMYICPESWEMGNSPAPLSLLACHGCFVFSSWGKSD
jgi:hypothetical protein